MNYIKQINAFKNYLAFHDMPSTAILLWHTLMMINNMAGWKRRFNASNALVQQYGGLSKQRLSDARKVLVKHGLIHYEVGAKGRAPVYEMVVLDGSWNQGDVQEVSAGDRQDEENQPVGVTGPQALTPLPDESPDQTADSLADPSEDQLPDEYRTILKQKHKHKQKQKRRRGQARQNPFTFYDQNFQALRPAVREVIAGWCEESGDLLVLEAMQIAVMHDGKTLKYIEKILNGWSDAGLFGMDQVRDFEKQKKSKQEWKRSERFLKVQVENKTVLDKLRREMLV